MNILCIDDEPQILRILTKYLTMVGHAVKSASDGEDGLRQLSSQQPPFDLIITDVRMPAMTGLELIGRIRSLGVDIPVVVMSGHQDDEIDKAEKESGVVAVLEKPFSFDDIDELLTLVSRLNI